MPGVVQGTWVQGHMSTLHGRSDGLNSHSEQPDFRNGFLCHREQYRVLSLGTGDIGAS